MVNISKKLKLYLIAGITLILLIGLTGCTADIDKKYNGLSIGFNYENPKGIGPLVCAVRSDKTEFNINDLALDFHYGWEGKPPYIIEQSEDNSVAHTVGFILYILNPFEVFKSDEQGAGYMDESEIVFLKKIDAAEFVSLSHKIKITKGEGKQFQQSARLTVPKELLSKSSGKLWFSIAYETYSYSEGIKYDYFATNEYMKINYEYINENTVKLRK